MSGGCWGPPGRLGPSGGVGVSGVHWGLEGSLGTQVPAWYRWHQRSLRGVGVSAGCQGVLGVHWGLAGSVGTEGSVGGIGGIRGS